MVIAELDDYIVPFLAAETELKQVKLTLLENDPIKAYVHILNALVALHHARNIIAASMPDETSKKSQTNSSLELQ